MKLLICGKGGSGKTTISILLAKLLRFRGFNAYIIDIDESNRLLPKMLGVKQYPKPLVQYLGGRKKLIEFMKQKSEVDLVEVIAKAKEGIKLEELPSEYVAENNEGIKLLVIGKIGEFGEGCACPLNYLSKVVLKNLILPQNTFVLIDTDAGVEHVGRGVEEVCDGIVTVLSPEAEAIEIAKLMKNVANQLSKRFWVILNKFQEEFKDFLNIIMNELAIDKVYVVNFDKEVFMSCLKGTTIKSERAVKDLEAFANDLVKVYS